MSVKNKCRWYELRAELAGLIETGPNPKTDRVVRWRRVDLREVIWQRFGVIPTA